MIDPTPAEPGEGGSTADRVVRGLIGPVRPIGVAALALDPSANMVIRVRGRPDRERPPE